jgi:hypothetical protein
MPGPRIFELEEANELLPDVEALLGRIDRIRDELKALKIRINALEMIWGPELQKDDCPDHAELQQHLADMKRAEEEFEQCTQDMSELGAQIKGLDPALIDFYGVREGRLVCWCWKRGEPAVDTWHHLDEGFAGRQHV